MGQVSDGRTERFRLLVGVLALFAVAATGWLAVWTAGSTAILGGVPTVVTSDSMAPTLRRGDVVVPRPYDGQRLDRGTVVVFREQGEPGHVVHRVTGVNRDGTYRTRGDANRAHDSTPVHRDQLVGTGTVRVPLLGFPLVWLWEGAWAQLALLVVFAGLVLWSWRFGAPPRGGPQRRRRTRPLLRQARLAGEVAVLVLIVAASVPTTARAAFADTTTNGTNSLGASAAFEYYLKTSGSGNRTSTPVLPLSRTVPVATTLPNYDTNRDAFPGLLIAKGGTGAGETDTTKYQTWSLSATAAITLSGNGRLTVWSAMKDFQTGVRGFVDAFLLDCPSSGSGCTTFDSASLDLANWSGGSATWVSRTIDFGATSRTVTAGRLLQVKLVVNANAADSMWFAYDTTSYPSALTVS